MAPVFFDTPPPDLPISMTATILKVIPPPPHLLTDILLPPQKWVKSLAFQTFGEDDHHVVGIVFELRRVPFYCIVHR